MRSAVPVRSAVPRRRCPAAGIGREIHGPDLDPEEPARECPGPVSAATLETPRPTGPRWREPAPDWGRPSENSAWARVILAVVSLGSVVAGVAEWVLGNGTSHWIAFLVLCTVGIGSAPWQMKAGLGLATRLTLTGATALCVWTLPASVMAMTGWWHPWAVLVPAVLFAVPLHVRGFGRAWREIPPWGRRPAPTARVRTGLLRPGTSMGVAVAGTALCVGSALVSRHIDPGLWGFLPRIGPAWYLGLALVLVGFVMSLGPDERPMAVAAVLLVVVLTLTPALVYDGPRAQSAYKHIDLALQIRHSGVLRSSVSIYDAWPGFFAAMAWLADVLGIRDSGVQTLATFWPPLLALFRVTALRALAGRLLDLPAQRWIAVVLAVLVDSLGADYFSPQSVGFVLGLAAFALALSNGLGHLRVEMLLIIGCTLALSHQLSPFVVSGVLIVLALFRQVRPWWIPLLVAVPTVAWAALHLGTILSFVSLDALGRLSNFEPPPQPPAPGLSRLPVVPATVTALVVAVLLLGALALVALVRTRHERRSWAIATAPAVGLLLIAINPYGQEGIFRAVLFAIPWLAILAARLFEPSLSFARASLLATTLVLTSAFLVAGFGLDGVKVIRSADVAAVTYPQQHSGNSFDLLNLGAGDLPDSLRRGATMLDRERLQWPLDGSPGYEADADVLGLTSAYVDYAMTEQAQPSAMYAVWSPTSAEYDEAYGLQHPGQFDQLRDALARSPYWHVVLRRDGTYLFQLDPAAYLAARAAAGR